MPRYLKQDEARELRDAGDDHLAETLSAFRVTTTYQPKDWEMDLIEDRLAFYQDLGAVGQIREGSREALCCLILSLESIIRRRGCVAFPNKKDLWAGRISHRLPSRLLNSLRVNGLLIEREIQVSKKPNVYDASQEYLDALPTRPEDQTEGKLVSDRPWQPVVIRRARDDEVARFGDPDVIQRVQIDPEAIEQEMVDLNAWYAANSHRVQGVDDLRFHRLFHHNYFWGGRIYGEFTQMDRDLHRPNILIDGEPTDEADLNGSYLSFFLLLNGWQDLPDDPYQHGALAEYDRRLVKKVMVLLFGKGEWWSRSYIRTLNPIKGELGYPDRLPEYREFQAAVFATYPELEGFQRFKPTLKFEQYESRALIDTLAWLRDRDEIGLPIHDGIRVRQQITAITEQQFQLNRALTIAN